jgi:hypothetical protein
LSKLRPERKTETSSRNTLIRRCGTINMATAKHADLDAAAKRCRSQAELAQRIGMGRSVLSHSIRHCGMPRPSSLSKEIQWALLEVTGKTIDELWPARLCRDVPAAGFTEHCAQEQLAG